MTPRMPEGHGTFSNPVETATIPMSVAAAVRPTTNEKNWERGGPPASEMMGDIEILSQNSKGKRQKYGRFSTGLELYYLIFESYREAP